MEALGGEVGLFCFAVFFFVLFMQSILLIYEMKPDHQITTLHVTSLHLYIKRHI